ncbi:MAG: hypothetical protein L6311_07015 [Cellulomonas sp.]|nr:hypothetical protein [Cellulomonas sp.]
MNDMPRGLYGPNRDGAGDPDAVPLAERLTRSPQRLAEEHNRAHVPLLARLAALSPFRTAPDRFPRS